MAEARIQVVDEDDNVVGSATFDEVWGKGLKHRIVRVMVEDPEGKVLLQKRLPTQDLYPGRWDCSAGGHVDDGDNYLSAAKRELHEEVGLSNVGLEELGSYQTNKHFEWRKLNRFNKVYKVIVPRDTHFTPQPSEVETVQWFSVEEVKNLVHLHPDKVTDGLIEAVERYYL